MTLEPEDLQTLVDLFTVLAEIEADHDVDV